MHRSARPEPPENRAGRVVLVALIVTGAAGAAAITLDPVGQGWAWGSPASELRWYLTGFGSSATRVQLVGNVALLVPMTVPAVLLWPRLAHPDLLLLAGTGAGTLVELLQWWLPLGRVVSPLDAVLNATGVLAAGTLTGLLVARLRRRSPPPRSGPPRASAPTPVLDGSQTARAMTTVVQQVHRADPSALYLADLPPRSPPAFLPCAARGRRPDTRPDSRPCTLSDTDEMEFPCSTVRIAWSW